MRRVYEGARLRPSRVPSGTRLGRSLALPKPLRAGGKYSGPRAQSTSPVNVHRVAAGGEGGRQPSGTGSPDRNDALRPARLAAYRAWSADRTRSRSVAMSADA